MLRLTLGGPGMEEFPQGQDGGYIKLQLPPAQGTSKPTIRTYTIRAQRDAEVDVDFALHTTPDGIHGPATEWAMKARPADTIAVGGPGPAKPLPPGHDFYLVAGDMTSLPAISVNLQALDPAARGRVWIEISSEADKQDLAHPSGVEINWLVNDQPGLNCDMLANAMRSAQWPEGNVYAWSACEFSAMKALRQLLREEHGLGPDQLYISSYWKSGLTEEDHKLIKREDAEAL